MRMEDVAPAQWSFRSLDCLGGNLDNALEACAPQIDYIRKLVRSWDELPVPSSWLEASPSSCLFSYSSLLIFLFHSQARMKRLT